MADLQKEMGLEILYEDNHLIALNKKFGQIVQGDKTGDEPLVEILKRYLKERYNKQGNVYCGLIHRLDRPVTGVVVFAKTDKALTRMNLLFQERKVVKKYWAIVKNKPPKNADTLVDYLAKNESQNKSYVVEEGTPNSFRAELSYRILGQSNFYYLLEVELHTGRHHQIRAQLAHMGCPIKGDLKYGSERSNRLSSVSLHARSISFIHPIKKEPISIIATVPNEPLFNYFEKNCN